MLSGNKRSRQQYSASKQRLDEEGRGEITICLKLNKETAQYEFDEETAPGGINLPVFNNEHSQSGSHF